jgi:hypothetical protein
MHGVPQYLCFGAQLAAGMVQGMRRREFDIAFEYVGNGARGEMVSIVGTSTYMKYSVCRFMA